MRRLALAATAAVAPLLLAPLSVHAAWTATTRNPTTVVLAVLAPPTNVSATASAAPPRVTVSWTPPAPAQQGDETRILRLGPTGLITLVAPGGSTSSYVDTAVQAGSRYCYLPYTAAGTWTAYPPLTSAVCATP